MNTQIHKPSRKQAILFFIFTLLLAATVFAWAFFLNKGTLVAEGIAPFTIKVGTDSISCQTSPCPISLTPRSYDITFKKDGYSDITQNLNIKRWKELKTQVDFQFIPSLKDIGEVVLPTSSAPLRVPFIGMKRLENFPKNVKEASFSPSGNKALLTLGKEVYIYDVTTHVVTETSIGSGMLPTWVGEKIVFLMDDSETVGKQLLKTWNDGKPEILVSFLNKFESPRLIGSPNGKDVLIENSVGSERAYYLVDTEKKTRNKLSLASQIENAKWVGDYIVFKTGTRIFALSPDTLGDVDLPATDIENIIESSTPNSFIFLAGSNQDSDKKTGISISDVLNETQKEITAEKPVSSKTFLTEFNLTDKTAHTLVEIPLAEGESVHRLTAETTWQALHFILAKGSEEKLFEVVLKP
jgi:hypothetical protein